MTDESLYVPPDAVNGKPPKTWSAEEAQIYFDWLLAGIDERIATFLDTIEETVEAEPETLLMAIGQKMAAALKQPQFQRITPAGKGLSHSAYTLSADVGLVLAKLLLAAGNGRIRWQILTSPETDRSLNMPVLVGFGKAHCDPILASIIAARALSAGNGSPDAWRDAYRQWSGRIG